MWTDELKAVHFLSDSSEQMLKPTVTIHSVSAAGGLLQRAQTPVHLEAAAGVGDELSGWRGDGSEDQSPPQTATPPPTQTPPGHPEETEDPHGQNRYGGQTWCYRGNLLSCVHTTAGQSLYSLKSLCCFLNHETICFVFFILVVLYWCLFPSVWFLVTVNLVSLFICHCFKCSFVQKWLWRPWRLICDLR